MIKWWIWTNDKQSHIYTITDLWIIDWEETCRFECKSANMDEVFLREDIEWVIVDLKNILNKINK